MKTVKEILLNNNAKFRPKIIVYVLFIKFLGSCMYRYTRYTIHDVFVYCVSNSDMKDYYLLAHWNLY